MEIMYITLNGFNTNSATFYASPEVREGDIVKVCSDLKVSSCEAGDLPCGVCLNRDESHACVQLQGYARVKYSGANPTYGRIKIAADGKGGFMLSESGTEVLLVTYDLQSKTADIIF